MACYYAVLNSSTCNICYLWLLQGSNFGKEMSTNEQQKSPQAASSSAPASEELNIVEYEGLEDPVAFIAAKNIFILSIGARIDEKTSQRDGGGGCQAARNAGSGGKGDEHGRSRL